MKLRTPLPQPLPAECIKATQIFRSFVDRSNNGLDGVIPRQVLEEAKGFAIYSLVKAGFVLSARAGSGIVIARLPNGEWSAPSAIGTAGMGLGTQAGAELTDVLIVLNSTAAIRSFMSAGSVTLGTNLSVAVGPLGRNGEASGSISTDGQISATYFYSKTRGLFGGVSLEGSVIVERQDANALAYGDNVSARQLLSGVIGTPHWAHALVETLDSCTSFPGRHQWINDTQTTGAGEYMFEGIPNSSESTHRVSRDHKRSKSSPWFHRKSSWVSPPVTRAPVLDEGEGSVNLVPKGALTPFPFTSDDHETIDSPIQPYNEGEIRRSPSPKLGKISKPLGLIYKRSLTTPLAPGELGRVIALYDFKARESGDLTFTKGDVITIISKTNSTSDWWTGVLNGKKGTFPANFVEEV